MSDHRLYLGDCRSILPTLPDASVDAVVCDPPYPCIDREYGYWTEEEWFDLMKPVVRECRRVLKPQGSAVFILQPNSERVGRMRLWLFDFISWAGREWNLVQDAWWWNDKAMPGDFKGLMRPSLKACVWLGSPDCYRDQDSVLWTESDDVKKRRARERARGIAGRRHRSPSGHSVNTLTKFDAAERRGGVTPFNLLIANHGYSQSSAGSEGHGAGTPEDVADWWIRYLTRPDDTVLDPFSGTGTTGRAALRLHRKFIGIEAKAEYHAIAERLLAGPPMPLFEPTERDDTPRQASLFS